MAKLVFATDDVVWLSWKRGAEEAVRSLRHTNEVIVSYVTAVAMFHLYQYLDRLRENAIYFDTDSVIYILPRDESAPIETDEKLGDITSELRPSKFISEFAGGVPKNYAYKVMTDGTGMKTLCKVRGITLNYNASKLVNFERFKDIIFRSGDEYQTIVNVHTEKKIKRKRNGISPHCHRTGRQNL